MESVARQRTIMSSDDLKYYLEKLLLGSSLTSQEANPHILEVFSFLSTPTSSIIVAEVPQSYVDRISPKTLDTYISAQSSLQVNQTQADHLPVTIYYPTDPDFSPLTLTPSIIEWKDHQIPIERGIWNGTVSVNLASTTSLGDNRTVVRLSVPLVANISAASLIAKAIAEGGALGNFTRNQIEGWCSYHNIGVEVTHSHEKLLLTFEAPVTELHTASEKLLSLLQVQFQIRLIYSRFLSS